MKRVILTATIALALFSSPAQAKGVIVVVGEMIERIADHITQPKQPQPEPKKPAPQEQQKNRR